MVDKFVMPNGDLGKMSTTPARVGTSEIEALMAAPYEQPEFPFPIGAREAVYECLQLLEDVDRLALEARYYLGKSYYEIAQMLGYSSKASAYDRVKTAEKKLGAILIGDKRIMELLEDDSELE